MSFYIILYLLLIITFFILGISVYKKYKDISGYYFLIFTLSGGLWLVMYFISFYIFSDSHVHHILSKTGYFLSIVCIFSFVYFIEYFSSGANKLLSRKNLIIHIFAVILFIIYVISDLIVQGMYLDLNKNDFYEIQGNAYILHILLNLYFFPLFIYTTYKKYNDISYLNKLRLKYILFGVLLLIILTLVFQLILPLFNIWILEKEIGFFFIPFIILTFYSIHKYNLSNIKVKIGEIIVLLLSLSATIFLINIFKYYLGILGNHFGNYWGINNEFGIVDIIIGILCFSIIHKALYTIFLGNNQNNYFRNFIFQLKKEIPYITNLNDLNNHLEIEFHKKMKVKYFNIGLFGNEKNELYNFFQQKNKLNIFINDIVFIQENKHKFDKEKIISEICDKAYLIFPMYDNKNILIGYLCVGKKPFEDHYYNEEINILTDFKLFLEGHLKYLDIYKKIHELSVNLDQQVDKQTIEYNQLINKQKEFINVISHEVKGPIASSIFQIDNIIDDYKNDDLSKQEMQKELFTLNELLLKTGDLVNKLFSIQQFEMNSKSLFVQNIKIVELLKNEISIFQKIHPEIVFHTNFDEDIQYIPLDKVQFRQVIDNLINNALKIIDPQTGEMYISCKIKNEMIQIIIEDNGKGFTQLEINNIFEKYSTGKGSYIGLGMGLYLCRTIVELHKGNIQASFGKKLGGARIIINIPSV